MRLRTLTSALALALATRAARAEDAPPANVTRVRTPAAGAPGSESLASTSRDLPGAAGDVAAAAQNLPGVARPAPGATGLVMWGTAPAESRVTFDGIEIPALYHFGGFRSTVGNSLIERIDVTPGAYGAEDGRAIGGLVRVVSAPLEGDAPHLSVEGSPLDAGATLRVGPAAGWRLVAAGRWSVLDQTYGRLAPAASAALFPVPHYADAQVAVAHEVGAHATVRALVLLSRDRVRRDLDAGTPTLLDRTEDRRQSWWRAAVIYDERGEDDGFTVTAYGGAGTTGLEQRFAPTPASRATDDGMLGLRSIYRTRLADGVRLRAGVDGWLSRTRARQSGSLTVPAREGDLTVFGQPPGDDVNADAWSATVGDVGAYLDLPLTRGRWMVLPGLRADLFPVDGSRALPPVGATPAHGYAHLDGALDPRLAVTFAPCPRLVIASAGGLYHQPVDAADLSAVFGSPNLRPARAWHATLGARARLTTAVEAEATAFYRRIDDVTERSSVAPPALALVSDQRGRSTGVQVVARIGLGNALGGWVAYTLSRAERWAPATAARLFDFDQTHVATAVGNLRRGAWTFGVRLRYATGMPRTPVVATFVDLRDGIAQPLFGPQNSTRLPAFFQADARVDRTWRLRSTALDVFLDIENASDRHNAEEIVYSRDYASHGYLTGPPTLVLLGLRIES